jgi:hypothetical protein
VWSYILFFQSHKQNWTLRFSVVTYYVLDWRFFSSDPEVHIHKRVVPNLVHAGSA